MAESGDGSYTCDLTEAELKKAKDELFEDPKQMFSQVQTLREWVLQQPHLTCRTDDGFLIRFLRVAKYSQTRARKQLDHFVSMRAGLDTREWYNQTGSLSDIDRKVIDMGYQFVLQDKDDEGRVVVVIRPGCYDTKEITIGDTLRIGNTMGEIFLKYSNTTQVHGMVTLIDFTGFGMSHAAQLTPGAIQKAANTWQECIPYRVKATHYYNSPVVFNAVFTILQLFLKEKTKKRNKFHKSSLSSLHSSIPKRILPEEYGGDAGPIQQHIDFNKRLYETYAEEMRKNAAMALDETKRPAAVTGGGVGLGGVEGSFRKLNVD